MYVHILLLLFIFNPFLKKNELPLHLVVGLMLNRPTTSGKSRAHVKILMPSISFVSEWEFGIRHDDFTNPFLCTMHPAKKFVTSPDSPPFASAFDVEVNTLARSSVPSTSAATGAVGSAARPLSKRKGKKGISRSSPLLHTSSPAGCSKFTVDDQGGFSGSDFPFGRVRSIADVDRNIFGEVYIPE